MIPASEAQEISMERKIFGKPIRKSTTLEFYPDKLTLEEFCSDMKSSIDSFKNNLEDLPYGQDSHYIEEWLECIAAWMEIEEER